MARRTHESGKARLKRGRSRAAESEPLDRGPPPVPKAEEKASIKDEPAAAAPAVLTPLDVMLAAMREEYVAGRTLSAAGIAKSAAPYLHQRRSGAERPGEEEDTIVEVSTGIERDEA